MAVHGSVLERIRQRAGVQIEDEEEDFLDPQTRTPGDILASIRRSAGIAPDLEERTPEDILSSIRRSAGIGDTLENIPPQFETPQFQPEPAVSTNVVPQENDVDRMAALFKEGQEDRKPSAVSQAFDWLKAPTDPQDVGATQAISENILKTPAGVIGAFVEAGKTVWEAGLSMAQSTDPIRGIDPQLPDKLGNLLRTTGEFIQFAPQQMVNALTLIGANPVAGGAAPVIEIARRKLAGNPMTPEELRAKWPIYAQAGEEMVAFPAGPAMALSIAKGATSRPTPLQRQIKGIESGGPPVNVETTVEPQISAKEGSTAKKYVSDIPSSEVATGRPITFDYIHNTKKSPNMGAEFAQDIEPAGKYVNAGRARPDIPNLESGTATLKNPLVVENVTPRPGGWKTTISNQFGGKTGSDLSSAILKAGHDGIITKETKRGFVSEIVLLEPRGAVSTPVQQFKAKVAEAKEAVKPKPSGRQALERKPAAVKVEPPKPPAPPKSSIPEPPAIQPENVAGLSKADITEIRDRIGRSKLPEAERRRGTAVVDEAIKSKSSESALEVATEAMSTKRQVTDVEHAGMILKSISLEKEHTSALADAATMVDKGDIAGHAFARQRADAILDQLDVLTEGATFAKRETARALAFMGRKLDTDTYGIAKVMQRAKAAKGKKLTPEETTKIESLVKTIAERDKALQEATARETDLLKDRERLIADKVTAHEKRVASIVRHKKSTQEKLATEQAKLETELAKMGLMARMGLDPQMAFTLGKYAVTLIKQGANSLDAVAKQIRRKYPELTDSDIYEALATRDPRRQAKARTEAAKRVFELKRQASLLNQIEKAEIGIFNPPKNGKSPTPTAIKALQKRLRELRVQAYKSGMHPDQLARAVQRINELQDQLANHFRTVRKGKRLESPELATARQQMRDLQKEMRVEDQLTDLNEQLRTGEFVVHEKPKPRPITPEFERKQVELKRAQRLVGDAIADMQPWTPGRIATEVLNASRTALTTADMSAALRQGLILSAMNPKSGAKAFGRAFKATFSKFSAEKYDVAMRAHPNHYLREKSGLFLAEPGRSNLTRAEEMFQSNLVEQIPAVGEVVKASNRNMTTILNQLRVDAFDRFVELYPNATTAELKAWANVVNVFSGRGNLGSLGKAGKILPFIFFAPKFAASRIQSPFMWWRYWKLPRVRKEAAKVIVKFATLGATVLALAKWRGAEVETDVRSSDWGKIRIGDARYDIWGGIQQPMRLAFRIGLSGIDRLRTEDPVRNSDPFSLIGQFVSYKFAPPITLAHTLLTGKNIIGQKESITETTVNAMLPLVIQDIRDAWELEGPKKAAVAGTAAFFGLGVSTFKDSESATRRRIKALVGRGKDAEAIQLWKKHNSETKGRRISERIFFE